MRKRSPGTCTRGAGALRPSKAGRRHASDTGVCYVLPRFDDNETQHFAHIPALAEKLAEHMPVGLIIEKGTRPAQLALPDVLLLTRGDGNRLLRAAEFAIAAYRMSHRGYRKFFLRYSATAATVLLIFRRLLGIRVYYWASGQADMASSSRSLKDNITSALDHRHFAWLTRNVDYFVTGPESMTRYMASRWGIAPSRIRLLYNDVDTTLYRPLPPAQRAAARERLGWDDSDFVVLFVHHLSTRRGSRLLAPFADRLLGMVGPTLRLVVVGDGPDLEIVRTACRGGTAGHRVDVLGPVPNRQLPSFYAAADCLLMPSYEEGFPRVILEAMASACPIVATRAGGTVDVVGSDYPFVAATGDLDQLVANAAALFHSPSLRSDLGERLRARAADRFDTSVVAKMMADVLA